MSRQMRFIVGANPELIRLQISNEAPITADAMATFKVWEDVDVKVPFTQEGDRVGINYVELMKMLPYKLDEWTKVSIVNHE